MRMTEKKESEKRRNGETEKGRGEWRKHETEKRGNGETGGNGSSPPARLLVSLCLLLALCLLTSCGYELVRDKGIYGGDIASVSVPMFKNASYEPHIPGFITDAFTKELINTGLFQVNNPGSDAYVEGTVRRVRAIPYTVNKNGTVLEKRVDVYLDIALYRKDGTLLRRWNFSDFETYQAEVINYEEFNKQEALKRVSERLARRFSAALLMDY
jgi:hypothetical protein